ncbi:MAG: polyprenyl diphosphate synthase [Candidatus Paceibacterota bacterium]
MGVVMDGNRRWAKRNGLPTVEGHRVGYNKLNNLMQWAKEEKIPYVIVYAFSSENWNRSEEEVSALMGLFRHFFRSQINYAKRNNVKIVFIGERERLPKDIQTGMTRIERETQHNTALTLVIAAPYGSRGEIVDAINRILDTQGGHDHITEDIVSGYLWTSGIPDPDLIIRTGGRRRLSNFLLWQAAYAELYFSDTLWPDFVRTEFTKVLYDYSLRKRSFGK